MHRPINVKSPSNTTKWQVGFNSAFKGLRNAEDLSDPQVGVAPWKYKIGLVVLARKTQNHPFRSLSYDRPIASYLASSPQSAI
jgi:hypothetical protein